MEIFSTLLALCVGNSPVTGHSSVTYHYNIIKWKHFPRYWSFARRIHWSPVNFPHKGQWCGALMFSLICTWTNGWLNNRDAVDLRCHRAHYDVTVMMMTYWQGSILHQCSLCCTFGFILQWTDHGFMYQSVMYRCSAKLSEDLGQWTFCMKNMGSLRGTSFHCLCMFCDFLGPWACQQLSRTF